MIFGQNVIGQSVFAQPDGEQVVIKNWTEVCKDDSEWIEIDAPANTIKRCTEN